MHKYALIAIVFVFSRSISAQVRDSNATYNSAVENTIAFYHQSIGDQSPLYNGARHEGYRFDIKGHAYFQTKEWVNGSVIYDGILYKNAPMLYDEINEELVVQHPEKKAPITLASYRITRFSLSNHVFINLHSGNDLTMSGFYDLLYSGKTSLLVKRKKYIHENISQLQIERKIISQDHYYIQKSGNYYQVQNMKRLFQIFEDRNKEIKLFIKENNLDFKSDPEPTLTKIAKFYDQLNGSI